MHSPDARDPSDVALALFVDWLQRREAGGSVEFEALVREHPSLADALRAHHANWLELAAAEQCSQTLGVPGPATEAGVHALTTRLATRAPTSDRYTDQGEFARGGMGSIRRVFDRDFRRALAMKIALPNAAAPSHARPSPQILARFLAEAQITGQLDHPGIVPVHELGLDSGGRLYFTMKLVEGRDLRQIFQLVFESREGWNVTRALGVLLKVCEAVAYAHEKGVIHRDLKPANIMVGSFGEVYVMDWGLARELGAAEPTEPRRSGSDDASVRTERSDVREQDVGSGLLTIEGDVLGTPAYMPPEQARGELDKLTPQSDVYSVGAMLYHLLARQVPYVPNDSKATHVEVLARVIAGSPRALNDVDRALPAELVAICDKAMARDPGARYPHMLALADDLRAFIEGRVVRAYEAGAWAEARKWILRNRALAAAIAIAVLAVVAGAVSFALKADEATRARDALAFKNEELERARADADRHAELARATSAELLSLSAQKDLDDLVERARKLWPPHPELIPAYERWLAEARELVDGRDADPARGLKKRPSLAEHRAKLADLRSKATANESDATHPAATSFEYDDPEAAWWDRQLAKLIADIETLSDPENGLMSAALAEPFGWGIAKRLEFARTISERSVTGTDARARWEDALAGIRGSPRYGGFELRPQLGLLPIGVDRASGLFEFAHLASGEPAARGADGTLLLEEATGLVFVLIPGGTFWMGAQATDPNGRNFDAQAEEDEGPVREVRLSPYFVSKDEMTQAQWQRVAAHNPSIYKPPYNFSPTLLHPVEQVSWLDCVDVLGRVGLTLPSEAQWEHAARAGTSTRWWTGAERESLRGKVNLADQTAKHAGAAWGDINDWPDLEDGGVVHTPGGTYPANAFGLHDVAGNLWELCLDGYDMNYYERGAAVDPLAPSADANSRVTRGGSFDYAAMYARSANRDRNTPELRSYSLGVRPARAVTW
ncbi:MAG: bifunctional serine/threonine-protein kinase/formylglycine-generating enzyme family protein [Planctomycetes bacterium]|nr:bifunctional serine/threonine-protein kinase/formylglycine-generating enzyme family protein [Planctomycetota bacterium]